MIADADIDAATSERQAYLLHTMRVLWVQYETAQHDLVAVASALKIGLINNEMAIGLLAGYGILHLLGEDEYRGYEYAEGVVLPDALPMEPPP
jgi:hypothetical protein